MTTTTIFSDIVGYTAEIRHHQEMQATAAEKRRQAVLRHIKAGRTVAEMARATGLSEPAIRKIKLAEPSLKAQRRGVPA